MAWRDVAWHGVAWRGMAWHGMAWHGMAEPERPEVFFSGCLHGNERIGPPTLTELAILLVENYGLPSRSSEPPSSSHGPSPSLGAVGGGRNAWLKRLVDTRVIYMMPTTNALVVWLTTRKHVNGAMRQWGRQACMVTQRVKVMVVHEAFIDWRLTLMLMRSYSVVIPPVHMLSWCVLSRLF